MAARFSVAMEHIGEPVLGGCSGTGSKCQVGLVYRDTIDDKPNRIRRRSRQPIGGIKTANFDLFTQQRAVDTAVVPIDQKSVRDGQVAEQRSVFEHFRYL